MCSTMQATCAFLLGNSEHQKSWKVRENKGESLRQRREVAARPHELKKKKIKTCESVARLQLEHRIGTAARARARRGCGRKASIENPPHERSCRFCM